MNLDEMNRSPEFKALERLVFLKHYKDNHGKNDYYLREQPKAWEKAQEIVGTNTPDFNLKLTLSPPAPVSVNTVEDERGVTIDDMNRTPEYKALERLLFLKHYKDNHGKNDYYLREQPKAWKVAKDLVEDCSLDYAFKLLKSSPPAPVKPVGDESKVK